MKTIIITRHLPKGIGGRPMKLGQTEFSESGHIAFFMGYDDRGYKIAITRDMLEEISDMENQKITIKVTNKKFKKSRALSIYRRLTPQSIREQLAEPTY